MAVFLSCLNTQTHLKVSPKLKVLHHALINVNQNIPLLKNFKISLGNILKIFVNFQVENPVLLNKEPTNY